MRKKLLSTGVAMLMAATVATAFVPGEVYAATTKDDVAVQETVEGVQDKDAAMEVESILSKNGEEAATIINSVEDETTFNQLVKAVLDKYYEDDKAVSSELEAFSKKIDSRAEETLKNYADAHEERTFVVENIFEQEDYVRTEILITTKKSASKEEIEKLAESEFDGILECIDLTITDCCMYRVKLLKGQTTNQGIEIASKYDFVRNASRNGFLYPAEGIENHELKLSSDSVSLEVGKTKKLTAKFDGSATKSVKWTSSDESVAKVSSNGKVTAVGKGTATICAVSMEDGRVTAECKVSVKQKAVKVKATTKLFKTTDGFTFNHEYITSYKQMKKIVKKYSECKGTNKKVLNQLKKYNNSFFKKNILCIDTNDILDYQKMSISAVTKTSDSNGKTYIDVKSKVTGKEGTGLKGEDGVISVQCFVEIAKSAAGDAKKVNFN